MSTRRILIVDDDADLLEMLEVGVESYCEDCHVVSAQDGFKALEQLRKGPFDLVLTDYQMPGMTGLELAQVMRETAPDTPVVLMTGCLQIADLPEKIRALNLWGYIQKPFGLKQIWDILHLSLSGI